MSLSHNVLHGNYHFQLRNYNYIPFPLTHRKKNAFAVHYVKEGPKVDSSVSSPNSMEPQYATCGAAVTVVECDEYATGLCTFSSIKHVVDHLQFHK